MKNKKPMIISIMIILGILMYVGMLYILAPKPVATKSQSVELKNGDTYNMTATYVTKIIDGVEYKMLGYNGSIPGPTINVEQGSEITIIFKNNTDSPQLLHSHGVRMDNAYDGSQSVQDEIKPGKSFVYKLKFPDAGVYWYHPHANEVYSQGLGLYGAFIVHPKNAEYYLKVNREIPVFLSDLSIEDGKIALDQNDKTHTLMGHYGSEMLVNGERNINLTAQKGEVVRMYVINAANARPFNFAIKGLKLKLVGGDSGAYEQPTMVDSVILGPSERAIVDVYFGEVGNYEIQNKTPEISYTLGTVNVIANEVMTSFKNDFEKLAINKDTVASIDPFRQFFTKTIDKKILLTLDMAGGQMSMQGMGHGAHMMPDGTMMGGSMMNASPDGIEWSDSNSMMNEMSDTSTIKWKIVDKDTGKTNMDIDWVFRKGEPVKIEIYNDPKSMHPMQHPIHFHGQRFLVLTRDGKVQTNLVWKDTTLVKSGETVEILLDPSNVGMWMAHCHISEHMVSGMMFDFKVE
jgi:suppressor of ftsI